MSELIERPTFQTPWEKTRDARLAKPVKAEESRELFSAEEVIPWRAEWKNMPEFTHDDLEPKFQVLVSFACAADLAEFSKVIGQSIPPSEQRQTKSVWFPEADQVSYVTKRYKAI